MPAKPKKIKETATMKMMRGNPLFDELPVEVQSKIIDYNKRGVGRPPATQAMRLAAEDKKRERERGRGRLKAATKRKDLDTFLSILEDMKSKNILGDKAADTELNKFIKQNKDVMIERKEKAIEETAEDVVDKVLKQAQKEVRIEEGGPVKLKVVEEFSKTDFPPDERTDEKMQEAARMRKAIKAMERKTRTEAQKRQVNIDIRSPPSKRKMKPEKMKVNVPQTIEMKDFQQYADEPITKRSQLSDHFSNYDKSKPAIKPKTESKFSYSKLDKRSANEIRDRLFPKVEGGYDDEELKFVWDNFLSENLKQELLYGGFYDVDTLTDEVADVMTEARRTSKFIPENLVEMEHMTKEERQIDFHRRLVEVKMKEKQKQEPAKNNFGQNTTMGSDGTPMKTLEPAESKYDTPDVFQDYETILDDRVTDNAYMRELYKGIDPDSIVAEGIMTPDEIREYFNMLNRDSNEQDQRQIDDAVETIEILSGGNNDTLFGAQDLLSARPNNPASRGVFQQDIPDDIDDNPAPISRGRNAQAVEDVNPNAFTRQDRIDAMNSIALGLGALSNVYRGVFNKNDIPDTRQDDILKSIDQNMKLIGKRGIYGDDKSLKEGDDMYEGMNFTDRIKNLDNFAHYRNHNTMGGVGDPNKFQKETEQADQSQQLAQAMMFNKGTGVMGSSLPQLRQQEIGYQQANRRKAHDGYAFIKEGRRRQLLIDSEFEP